MSEEEVGQEFDRVIRAAMMAAGQLKEHLSRRTADRDRQTRDAAMAAQRQQEQHTAHVAGLVRDPAFWENATGERVANAATYGATLYNTDRNAADVYDTVRDQTWQRWGINVDELRAQFPDSEDARRNALANAIDDRLAAARDDALAADDRSAAAKLHQDATTERDAVTETQPIVDGTDHDAKADRLEERADDALEQAYVHEVDHDHDRDLEHASANVTASAAQPVAEAQPTTEAGRVRQQVRSSYPHGAKQTLAHSGSGKAPRAKSQRKQQSPSRSSGLSR